MHQPSNRSPRMHAYTRLPLFPAFLLGMAGLLLAPGCASSQLSDDDAPQALAGCDGQLYPDPETSPYVIPFPAGSTITTGLANCSSSFHGAGEPDRYATDFDFPVGTYFTAARGGTVSSVDENEPSSGGGAGNHVLVDHGDGTQAYYLHAPADGIWVEVGDMVEPGDTLGIVGQSGQAGYPHLHFIVVTGDPAWPYSPVPVSFRNVVPQDVALKSHTVYEVE